MHQLTEKDFGVWKVTTRVAVHIFAIGSEGITTQRVEHNVDDPRIDPHPLEVKRFNYITVGYAAKFTVVYRDHRGTKVRTITPTKIEEAT